MVFYFIRTIIVDILASHCTIPLFDASISGQINFQRPATQTMEHLVDLHHDIFSILLFLCVIVFYLLAVSIYKFNASNLQTKRNFFFKSHSVLEICWTIIPMFVVAAMLYPSFALLYAMDELKDPVLSVKIIGHQWYWTYEIPVSVEKSELKKLISFDSYMLPEEDLPFGGFRLLEVDNRLYLPVKSSIRLLITSADVLHSWAVPSFGLKVDACPGRLNQASLYVERLGVFFGQCSEICGINHGFMPIVAEGLLNMEFLKAISRF